MDSRPEVMEEAGERERQRPHGASGLSLGLEHFDTHSSLRKHDGGGEAIGAGTDDTGALRGFSP